MEEKGNSGVDRAGDSSDELSLVEAARQGDKNAFGRLVRMHQKRVLRMVTAITGDLDSGMDVVQDSFVRAYQSLASFDRDRPFYPWISKIAYNLAINHLKRSRRQVGLSEIVEPEGKRTDDPLEILQEDENKKRFSEAIGQLPENYRVVFILRSVEELSYEEIADRLQISPGTVDSRLYRARRKLLESLSDLLD